MSDIDKRLDEELGLLKNWYLMVLKDEEPDEYSNPDGVKQSIKQLIASEFEKMIFEIDNPRSIDKGNEAYYDQAESFRLGYNLSIAMLRQKLEEWKK